MPGPGATEILLIGSVFVFYALFGVGFFVALYFAIVKGIARGMREGFTYAPVGQRTMDESDRPTS